LPFRQIYTYTAFDNLIERDSTIWDYPDGDWDFDYTAVNNRLSGSAYDNDGRVTSSESTQFKSNAAGRMTRNDTYYSNTSLYADGNGNEIRRSQTLWDAVEEEWGEPEKRYLIHSSVLGRIISEATETGKKYRTFVVANGTTLARQAVDHDDNEAELVGIEYRDASGLSARSPGGGPLNPSPVGIREELDGLGTNVGTFGDLSPVPRGNGMSPYDDIS